MIRRPPRSTPFPYPTLFRSTIARPTLSLCASWPAVIVSPSDCRSEEHTSELQSRLHLVCRPLLEKKKHARPTRPPQSRRRTSEPGAARDPPPARRGGVAAPSAGVLPAAERDVPGFFFF